MGVKIKKYGDLTEPTWHYNGTVPTVFSPSHWKHFILHEDKTLEPLDGVTGTVHVVDKSNALVPWAVKLALARARRLIIEQGLGPDSAITLFVDELDKILAQAKKSDSEALDAAAEIGHQAHEWIENLIKAILGANTLRVHELLATLPEDERAANCCVAAVSWMCAHNVRWIKTEFKALSLKHKVCGTGDGLAIVDSCTDPECCRVSFTDHLSLIDWKSSNALYVTMIMQMCLYWGAHEEEFPSEPIADAWLIRLGKEEAEFDPWYVGDRLVLEKGFQAFLDALALVRSLRGLESWVSGVRDARKAVMAERKAEQMKISCPKAKDYLGQRRSRCLPDGTQCKACQKKYEDKH